MLSTPSPSKLIFLDIDGVMNLSQTTVEKLSVMEEDLLILLRQLVRDVPHSALVLSSSWRYKECTRKIARDYFNDQRIPLFISCTPNLGTNRVDEILWWLAANTNLLEGKAECEKVIQLLKGPESRFPLDLPESEYVLKEVLEGVTHFVVIDDMDMAKEKSEFVHLVLPQFVHVDKKFGLREEDVEEAIRLLSL